MLCNQALAGESEKMNFGQINLFCPMCGQVFRINQPKPPFTVYHTAAWGYLCSKECYDKAELKYARMVLGKDDV